MQALARSYTMASERQVHDRFLLPGMEPLAAGSTNSKGSDGLGFGDDGDDDDLGDVFL
jgi:hypothetical protein